MLTVMDNLKIGSLVRNERIARIIQAPSRNWQKRLIEDLLTMFATQKNELVSDSDFEKVLLNGFVVDATSFGQILALCISQQKNVALLLEEALISGVKDSEFRVLISFYGHEMTYKQIGEKYFTNHDVVTEIYRKALYKLAAILIEKCSDDLSGAIITPEAILLSAKAFAVRSKGGNTYISDIASLIGCSIKTVNDCVRVLAELEYATIREPDETGEEKMIALSKSGIGLVEQMLATSQCWFHPGVYLRLYAQRLYGRDLSGLAEKLKLAPQTIEAIMDGNVPIGKYEAERLGTVFDLPPIYWQLMQELYDIRLG